MSTTEKTLPQQIIEISEAFTKTLAMENDVFQNQMNNCIRTVLTSLENMIALCKDAATIASVDAAEVQQNLTNTAQQAIADIKNNAEQGKATATPVPVTPAPSDINTLDAAAMHAISLSYENAVNAQNQAFILIQAITTQIIMTVISSTVATLGVAVKDALIGK